MTRRPLADFVDFLWLSSGYSQPHGAERVLPTGSMSLVLSLDDQGQIGDVVSGARTVSFVLDTSRPLNLLGVHFKPGCGFAFFALPAGELQDLAVSLEAVWGRRAQILREQLLEAASPETQFHIVERALGECLRRGPVRHPAVRYAIKALQNPNQVTSVASLVEQSGLTARRFIAAFRDEVGLAPKTFSRLARFRRVIRTLPSGSNIDWPAIAMACDYFDQAHFIHDFRAFSGIRPSDYVRYRTASPNHIRIPEW
ncbi:MAG TPA: helix-turn-helix domain-containing protein [Steroidobacteraceae bacterium]